MERFCLALVTAALVVASGCTASNASPPVPSAPSSDPSSAGKLQVLIDGARQEGALNLVWGQDTIGGSDGLTQLAQGFNKTYGLNVQVQFTPGPSMSEMSSKITQEAQTNQPATSDVYTGYASYLLPMIGADVLTPVDWSGWANNVTNPAVVAPNNVAVIVQTSLPGITYNTHDLTGDAVPTALADLLKPEYKGRIAAQNVGASFDTLASDEVWGEQKTYDYLKSFVTQTSGIIRCNDTERIADGEFDVLALDCSQSNALKAKAKGEPVVFVVPRDAPIVIYLYMGVPRNSAHPDAAELWINYMLSREAQDVLYQTDYADLHLLEGSKTLQLLQGLQAEGVQYTSSDVQFLQRQGDREPARQLEIRKLLLNGQS